MAIPEIKKQDVIKALKYIDDNGVPFSNQSKKYDLVSEDGKRYPPKYVVAVADHLANGTVISTEGFNAVEAKSYLEGLGFIIETKQQTIRSNGAEATSPEESVQQFNGYRNPFSSMLIESKNLILRHRDVKTMIQRQSCIQKQMSMQEKKAVKKEMQEQLQILSVL